MTIVIHCELVKAIRHTRHPHKGQTDPWNYIGCLLFPLFYDVFG